MKIAYLLDTFPEVSQTFILNEMVDLQKSNIDIIIFSIFNPKLNIIHTNAINLAKKTCYLKKFNGLAQFIKFFCSVLFANLLFFIRYPISYLETCYYICKLGSYKTFLRLGIATYLALLLRKLKVDHIHAHFAHIASEYAMLVSLLSGIPYSFTIHAYDIFTKSRFITEKIGLAKFVITISEYNKRFIKENFQEINEDKIYVIHCGVNLNKFKPECNINYKKKSFTILSVGRFIEKKGFKYLLEACNILIQENISDFMCTIVGYGPLERELEELTSGLKLSGNVQFFGPITNEEVIFILQETDVAVLPSIIGENGDMEGIPVYLMEAMSLKKPVISTHISGIPELVRNGAGILVPPKNPRALSEAVKKIYLMDLNSRKRMGQKGREIVEREFNIKKEVEKIKDLFMRPF